jgi:hypothetical protein
VRSGPSGPVLAVPFPWVGFWLCRSEGWLMISRSLLVPFPVWASPDPRRNPLATRAQGAARRARLGRSPSGEKQAVSDNMGAHIATIVAKQCAAVKHTSVPYAPGHEWLGANPRPAAGRVRVDRCDYGDHASRAGPFGRRLRDEWPHARQLRLVASGGTNFGPPDAKRISIHRRRLTSFRRVAIPHIRGVLRRW